MMRRDEGTPHLCEPSHYALGTDRRMSANFKEEPSSDLPLARVYQRRKLYQLVDERVDVSVGTV